MRILYFADIRSPTARNWISHFARSNHEVHVISTYPWAGEGIAGIHRYDVPLALSRPTPVGASTPQEPRGIGAAVKRASSGLWSDAALNAATGLTAFIRAAMLSRSVAPATELVQQIRPDLVHALRIPFEGILAASASLDRYPLIMSVWGNDFTYFARSNPLLGRQTRRALAFPNGLITDTRRDVRLAVEWGFADGRPTRVLPAAGGIRADVFHPGASDVQLRRELGIPLNGRIIINPRGFRPGWVRNDTFFAALPSVLQRFPNLYVICLGMAGQPVAEKWVQELNLGGRVRLLSIVPHSRMADYFRLAEITVSPSVHDGTPNSLLEAMACGCIPVAGGIESVREWIEDGVNGVLCDATSRESVGVAIERALSDHHLREAARLHNLSLIAERAEHSQIMRESEEFYSEIVMRFRS